MSFKAGNYFVGDLCYIVKGEGHWDRVCDNLEEGEFDDSIIGFPYCIWNTAWGDGEYFDQVGREYSVDAGLIGCISMNYIHTLNLDQYNDLWLEGGQIITFPDNFITYSRNGVIYIGDVIINTMDDEDAAEQDQYHGYEDEDGSEY